MQQPPKLPFVGAIPTPLAIFSECSLKVRRLFWEQDQVGALPTIRTNFKLAVA